MVLSWKVSRNNEKKGQVKGETGQNDKSCVLIDFSQLIVYNLRKGGGI